MKESPMLFNQTMVIPTLSGIKTQTRRLDGLKEINKLPNTWKFKWFDYDKKDQLHAVFQNDHCEIHRIKSKYGRPGDHIWGRENTELDETSTDLLSLSRYSADGEPVLYRDCDDPEYDGSVAHWDYSREVRPSIHMRRWESRIQLEITDVRVERIQDISETDAAAEGIEIFNEDGNLWYSGHMKGPDSWLSNRCQWHCDDPIEAFKALWDLINFDSGNGYASNPWVWVYDFKRIERPALNTAA